MRQLLADDRRAFDVGGGLDHRACADEDGRVAEHYRRMHILQVSVGLQTGLKAALDIGLDLCQRLPNIGRAVKHVGQGGRV